MSSSRYSGPHVVQIKVSSSNDEICSRSEGIIRNELVNSNENKSTRADDEGIARIVDIDPYRDQKSNNSDNVPEFVSAWTADHQRSYDAFVAKNAKSVQNGQLAPQSAEISGSNRQKPKLKVDKSNPDETVDGLAKILADSGQFFVRDGLVTVVHAQGFGAELIRLDVHGLIVETHRLCRPYTGTYSNSGSSEKDVAFPKDIASMMLSNSSGKNIPYLRAITSSPIICANGDIRCGNGYDPESQYYFDGVPEICVLIPANPSLEQAAAAMRKLREVFHSFPFADAKTVVGDHGVNYVDLDTPPGADESAGLTALLTAIARPSLNLSPGFIISAAEISGAGTGKGKFVRSICAIAYGWQPSAVTAGANSEELEKRLAAELLDSPACILIDNANGLILKSDLLASAISEQKTKTRILGKTQMQSMATSCLIVLTGNGLRIAEDLARRFVEVRLDAKTEDPEQRKFKGDIVAELTSRRADLIAAGMTILRFGRQNALPPGMPLGGFEQWSEWVRDPLLALGCVDPVLRISEVKNNDLDRQRKVDIFDAWWRSHGANPVTVSQLSSDVLTKINPQSLNRQYVAKAVQSLSGVRVGGYVMTQLKTTKWNPAVYALMKLDDTAAIDW